MLIHQMCSILKTFNRKFRLQHINKVTSPRYNFCIKKYFGELKEFDNATTTFQKELGKLLKTFNTKTDTSKPPFPAYMRGLEEIASLKMGLSDNVEDYNVFFTNFVNNYKIYKSEEKLMLAKRVHELNLLSVDILNEIDKNFLKDCQENSLSATQVVQYLFLLNQTNYLGEYKKYEGVLMNIMNESLKRAGASHINSLPLQIKLQFLFLNRSLNLENKLLLESVIKEISSINDLELYSNDKSPFVVCEIAYLIFRNFFYKIDAAQILSKKNEDQFLGVINSLVELFFFKDSAIYDINLQKYEFSEYKGNQIGIVDPLSWVSLSRCAEIIGYSSRFFNEDCFRRIEDGILRKYETDTIDLLSAAKIFYFNSLGYVVIDSNLYGRILDMVKSTLQSDKVALVKSGADSISTLMLLEGVSRVFSVGKEVDVPSLLFTLDGIANILLELNKQKTLTDLEKEIIVPIYEAYSKIFDFQAFLAKISEKN